MNRHERRKAAKLGDIVEIRYGRVIFDIKPGEDVSHDICYVCGKPATAWPGPRGMAHGFAEIGNNGKVEVVLLCERCFMTEEQTGGSAIIKKFLNAPDLKISKGGYYESVDQLRADIANASKERSGKSTN